MLEPFSTPHYRAFIRIANTYRCLAAVEVFFVVFLWPLLARRPGAVGTAALALMAVASLPLVLVAARVSGTPMSEVGRSQAVLLMIAAASVASVGLVLRIGPSASPYYYPIAAMLSGGLPLAGFVIRDVSGRTAVWLGCASTGYVIGLTVDR